LTNGQEVITTGAKAKSGGVQLPVAGEKIQSETGKEVREKFTLTDAAKFDELFKIMEEKDDFQYLDAFDREIWDSIRKREILEVEVLVKLPELYKMMNAVEDIIPFLDIMEQMGEEIFSDSNEEEMIKGFLKMIGNSDTDTIPVVCELESNSEYKFIFELSKEFLRMDISKLDGEMTLFGKVQKIIKEDQELEVYNMFSNFKSLIEMASKTNEKNKSADMDDFIEKVKGPAMKIIPIALYR
jgi:hypothetical protein